MYSFRLFLIGLLCSCQVINGDDDTFSAVVVEYSAAQQPSVDGGTNILNNVKNFVEFINTASSQMMADIVVFPEAALKGYYNTEIYMEVPDPADRVVLCAHKTEYEAPLVQLSCAARATSTYVVVNLGEQFFNTTLQSTLYFNTDVVFDRSGIVIARYRKIHLFGESRKSPSPDKEIVYFDTDFGVRFGLMTCFDIVFKDPGLVLAEMYNITHFIFISGWFSEMPFLTAIQEQWYWSYTADAVLLAAGYNYPSVGSSGTGIYLGRSGVAAYNMTETRGSFMIQANILKQSPSKGTNTFMAKGVTNKILLKEESFSDQNSSSSNKIKMKKDFLDVYTTESISVPEDPKMFNGPEVKIPFTIEREICQNSLCCNFSAEVTALFSTTKPSLTRGDDYSQLYYRIAVFDGVKNYEGFATGGIQTCAIIPCVNSNNQSCGLRSDDPSAIPNTFSDIYYQTGFIFNSIIITGNFSSNNSFVGPNVLLEGQGDSFGSLLLPDGFNFNSNKVNDITSQYTFQTVKPIDNLVLASLYGRLFSRDGQVYTGAPSGNSSGFNLYVNVLVLLTAISVVKYSLI